MVYVLVSVRDADFGWTEIFECEEDRAQQFMAAYRANGDRSHADVEIPLHFTATIPPRYAAGLNFCKPFRAGDITDVTIRDTPP